MKTKEWMLVLSVCFLLLTACSSSVAVVGVAQPSGQPTTVSAEEHVPIEAANLEVGVDLPGNISANEAFVISGFLSNLSGNTLSITHGASLFTYELEDASGASVKPQIDFLFRNDIGYSAEIKPDESYRDNGEEHRSKEYYEFVLTEPGEYSVRAKAHFHVEGSDGKRVEIELFSEPVPVVVN